MALQPYQLRIEGPLSPSAKTAASPVRAVLVTTETDVAVLAANYFDSAAARLPKGSIVDVVTAIGGTPKRIALVVTANTGTAVTVANAFAAPA